MEPDYQREGIRLYSGDCRDVLGRLKRESVDAVVTDPPYPRRYIPTYQDVWSACDSVMVDGAGCFAMVGQLCLPDTISSFPATWSYTWCGCFQQPHANTAIWPVGISSGWKPLLIYGKGKRLKFPYWCYDTVAPVEHYTSPKQHHKWGQSVGEFDTIIERFGIQGTILDPFMGSGTTALPCIYRDQSFIGIERERESFDTAVNRIEAAFDGVDAQERKKGQKALWGDKT